MALLHRDGTGTIRSVGVLHRDGTGTIRRMGALHRDNAGTIRPIMQTLPPGTRIIDVSAMTTANWSNFHGSGWQVINAAPALIVEINQAGTYAFFNNNDRRINIALQINQTNGDVRIICPNQVHFMWDDMGEGNANAPSAIIRSIILNLNVRTVIELGSGGINTRSVVVNSLSTAGAKDLMPAVIPAFVNNANDCKLEIRAINLSTVPVISGALYRNSRSFWVQGDPEAKMMPYNHTRSSGVVGIMNTLGHLIINNVAFNIQMGDLFLYDNSVRHGPPIGNAVFNGVTVGETDFHNNIMPVVWVRDMPSSIFEYVTTTPLTSWFRYAHVHTPSTTVATQLNARNINIGTGVTFRVEAGAQVGNTWLNNMVGPATTRTINGTIIRQWT